MRLGAPLDHPRARGRQVVVSGETYRGRRHRLRGKGNRSRRGDEDVVEHLDVVQEPGCLEGRLRVRAGDDDGVLVERRVADLALGLQGADDVVAAPDVAIADVEPHDAPALVPRSTLGAVEQETGAVVVV